MDTSGRNDTGIETTWAAMNMLNTSIQRLAPKKEKEEEPSLTFSDISSNPSREYKSVYRLPADKSPLATAWMGWVKIDGEDIYTAHFPTESEAGVALNKKMIERDLDLPNPGLGLVGIVGEEIQTEVIEEKKVNNRLSMSKKAFQCPQCNKRCGNAGALKTHMQSHKKPEPKSGSLLKFLKRTPAESKKKAKPSIELKPLKNASASTSKKSETSSDCSFQSSCSASSSIASRIQARAH